MNKENYDKKIRRRMGNIRDAQSLITNEINLLYNEISEHEMEILENEN